MESVKRVGVVLMTYGSPATLDDVETYMTNVRGGRKPEPELVEEFRRRYELIGGSPLIQITQQQAAALEEELNRRHPAGPRFQVVAGMRFSPPFVADVVPEAAADAQALIGLIMSPQYSPIIMGGYIQALTEAAARLGRSDLLVKVAEDWHLQPDFIEALAGRVRQALDRFPPEVRARVPVLFTAHSMPKRVVDGEPGYIAALKETAAAVAERVGLPSERWLFCYQSAGHTPEEWLKPDFADVMPELKAAGHTHVLMAPVQFLADHLEILYDIDVGAREQAEQAGLQFARIESLNVEPHFIAALAAVVEETLRAALAGLPSTSQARVG
ncbi:MAG: ferrochelatase [Thermogemmatispora sp.]|uniref:ferrochelatase n=1 Tax=Thermogemmatispora sp. TaxID=1968838 RepID=UPI00261A4331|nr:ferrochelatase [Thermogemmatispora sp.]MBX5458202.1 ferrochelatase [Thermogemmatispora sp.]